MFHSSTLCQPPRLHSCCHHLLACVLQTILLCECVCKQYCCACASLTASGASPRKSASDVRGCTPDPWATRCSVDFRAPPLISERQSPIWTTKMGSSDNLGSTTSSHFSLLPVSEVMGSPAARCSAAQSPWSNNRTVITCRTASRRELRVKFVARCPSYKVATEAC